MFLCSKLQQQREHGIASGRGSWLTRTHDWREGRFVEFWDFSPPNRQYASDDGLRAEHLEDKGACAVRTREGPRVGAAQREPPRRPSMAPANADTSQPPTTQTATQNTPDRPTANQPAPNGPTNTKTRNHHRNGTDTTTTGPPTRTHKPTRADTLSDPPTPSLLVPEARPPSRYTPVPFPCPCALRLEGLDEDEDLKGPKKMVTHKELVTHLAMLAEDLETAWGKGEKVKSLRIVIQSCKMLVNCQVCPSPRSGGPLRTQLPALWAPPPYSVPQGDLQSVVGYLLLKDRLPSFFMTSRGLGPKND